MIQVTDLKPLQRAQFQARVSETDTNRPNPRQTKQNTTTKTLKEDFSKTEPESIFVYSDWPQSTRKHPENHCEKIKKYRFQVQISTIRSRKMEDHSKAKQ